MEKESSPEESEARRKQQAGFTLVEVVAAAALIGMLFTMLTPSLSGAYNKVKNLKLKNDLAAIDQALEVYKMEKGELPEDLSKLIDEEYFNSKAQFTDAKGNPLSYSKVDDLNYTLSGQNSKGVTVPSPGSQ